MKLKTLALLSLSLCHAPPIFAKNNSPKPLQCVAFSPYVNQLTPNYGATPNAEIIDTLLDTLIKETPFRCIMSYGVLNGLEAIFPAAKNAVSKSLRFCGLIKTNSSTAIRFRTASHWRDNIPKQLSV